MLTEGDTCFGSHVSELIVKETHGVDSGHSGREYVNARLREKFWITSARSVINKVISQCFVCKRLHKKMCTQQMANLPPERVLIGDHPFAHCAVDVFGHFNVKRGRATVKRWCAIFTSMSIRAVHVEVLHSMDADSFINALTRFRNRRGVVTSMVSDRGTNFVGAQRELQRSFEEAVNSKNVQNELIMRSIEWKWNPPHASHFSGVVERCIRTFGTTNFSYV